MCVIFHLARQRVRNPASEWAKERAKRAPYNQRGVITFMLYMVQTTTAQSNVNEKDHNDISGTGYHRAILSEAPADFES